MNNTESIKQKLAEIKVRDRAKDYTHTLMHSSLAGSTMQAVQQLCEVADALDISFNSRFLIRTVFAGYVLRSGDQMVLAENIRGSALSTLFHVIKLTVSGEQQVKVLEKLGSYDSVGYYNSELHQKIIEDLQDVMGDDLEMSTPFEYAELVLAGWGVANFKKIAVELMNMAILLDAASQLSAEEIFVGTCVFVCQKYGGAKIYGLLQEFFPESVGASEGLTQAIASVMEALEEST